MIPLIFGLLRVNTIEVTAAPATHDIAVISVTPYPTSVEKGELVNITVVVKNQGTENETFDVKVYYDYTTPIRLIETKTVPSLGAGADTSLTFTWNTSGVGYWVVDPGTHTVIARASEVPGEEDTANNTLESDDKVTVISSPYIAVIPLKTVDLTLLPGKNYTVSIYTDYNGTDIWGYEFTLAYNPLVLQGVEVANGDLITTAKDPSATFTPGTFDNTAGKLSLTGAGFEYPGTPMPVTSGPGTLANITFTVVGIGDTYISLGPETRLIGYDAIMEEKHNIIDDVTPDTGHILDGYFKNTLAEVTHDIAVLSVTPNATSVVAGELANIVVVVKNNGTENETGIKVEVFYDYPMANYLIGTETDITLAAGANTSLTFTWDTTDVTKGDHTIIAKASNVPGEEDTANNTLESDEKVTVTLPRGPPLPIELIIGIVVVVVVVIAVAVYAVKRRKKPTPK